MKIKVKLSKIKIKEGDSKEKTTQLSTLNRPHCRSRSSTHHTPLHHAKSPPALRGGMMHEEQKDSVA